MADHIPFPVADGDSKPFWEGIARHKLLIQRCENCQRHIFYPRSLCPHCFSDALSWVEASGKGTIYSYTVVHQAYGPFAAQVPFVVAIVELAEGVRMMTRIAGAGPASVRIGMPVRVVFEQADENVTLPYFQLAEE
jgi:uncharacterized OB-fold protein